MLMKIADALSPEVRAELMRPARTFDPRMAQIVPGAEAKWFLVEVYSRNAERDIAKRGFGLYVPHYRSIEIRRGRKVDVRKPMFPGYVLAFMWNGGGNWHRLCDCDGVIGLVGALHEEEVDLVRAVENAQKFPRRTPRHHNRVRGRVLDVVRRRRWEDWLQQIRSLDSDKRNQALRKLLSLF